MNNEEPRLVPARRGFSVSWGDHKLSSGIDPVGAAEKAIQALPLQTKTLYLWESPLLGYGLSAMLSRLPPDSVVLGVEAMPSLARLFHSEMTEGCGDGTRFLFVPSVDPAEVCSAFREKWGGRRFRRVIEVKTNGAWRLQAARYAQCAAALVKDLGTEWSNAMTLVKLGRRYALNMVRNLALLPSSAPFFPGRLGNKTVLVCGAGPSLDKIEAMLPDSQLSTRDDYAIVAVDTALPALQARGIQPDLVVVLEAQHWNLRDFVGTGAASAIVGDFASLPASLELSASRSLFATQWTPLRFFARLRNAGLLPPSLPPMGSVGLAATALALASSRGPVITLGLDFSYSPDAYHAKGTPSWLEQRRAATRHRGLLAIDGVYRQGSLHIRGKAGRVLRSDPALRSYRDLFEREFGPIRRLFDGGETGLELGIPPIGVAEARSLLTDHREGNDQAGTTTAQEAESSLKPIAKAETVLTFMEAEKKRLHALSEHLSGNNPLDLPTFRTLLAESDYLFAHFPDRADTGAQEGPLLDPLDDAFLKRVRAEIFLFEKALSTAQKEVAATAVAATAGAAVSPLAI